ncbi:MAG: sulfite exporter TauE/SafE family protein [Actinocatenispora sp.]
MGKLLILGVVGLLAQLVDGSLGMAYGVTSTTLLLTVGVAPALASATVHLAEIGTTAASGVSHWRLGNVDWRTVGIMAVPGAIGAFLGATLLTSLPADSSKPWVAALLVALGGYVLWRFLRRGATPKQHHNKKLPVWFLGPLGLVAGTMDAIGGGGWGPIGTTSLLSSGRLRPRTVVGSIDTSEFVVTLGGSLGFLIALSFAQVNWVWVGMLLVGGLIAAPLAALLVRKLPARILGVAAGGLIVLTNAQTIMASVGVPSRYVPGVLIAMGALLLVVLGMSVRTYLRERRQGGPAVADEYPATPEVREAGDAA